MCGSSTARTPSTCWRRSSSRSGSRWRRRGGRVADKEVVRTEAAPAPFQGAPYSQAIRVGDLVFVSGQLALRPGETELMGGEIGPQTEQVLANLRAILEAAGSGLDRLVKTTVYLADLDDFAGVNKGYPKHLRARHPRGHRLAHVRRDDPS